MPLAKALDDPGLSLGRNRNKGKFIGIHGFFQNHTAEHPIVILSLLMAATAVFSTADGANGSAHTATHGHFLFDTGFNVRNDLLRIAAPADVSPCFDVTDPIFADDLCLKDSGYLPAGTPSVIDDTGLAHEHFCQHRQ